jgi:hypothetical protein
MIELLLGVAVTRNAPFWNERRAQTLNPTAPAWAAMTRGEAANRLPVTPSKTIEAITTRSGKAEAIIT